MDPVVSVQMLGGGVAITTLAFVVNRDRLKRRETIAGMPLVILGLLCLAGGTVGLGVWLVGASPVAGG